MVDHAGALVVAEQIADARAAQAGRAGVTQRQEDAVRIRDPRPSPHAQATEREQSTRRALLEMFEAHLLDALGDCVHQCEPDGVRLGACGERAD